MEKTENEIGAAVSALPPETRSFLGIGGAENPSSMPPADGQDASPLPSTDAAADEEEKREESLRMRRAVAAASARRLMRTDPSSLTDVGKRALYRSVTKGIFGVDDAAGVFFDRSGDVDANLAKLRKLVEGDLNAVKTPDQTAWEAIDPADEEARFRAAEKGLKDGAKSRMAWKGEASGGRGPGFWRMLWSGMKSAAAQEQGFPGDGMMDAALDDNAETARRTNYESLTDEEKAKWRKATIAEYERQLAKASPVAAFLSATHDMTDDGAALLARSFETGDVDRDELKALSGAEQEKVLTALALMRGDQRKGSLLFVPTDFGDDTKANRFQLMLYGLQQGFIDDFANIGAWGKAAWQQAYAKFISDESERRDYLRRIDLDARVKAALKQPLPDADTFAGAMFQGVAENAHWFIPYGMITKGGRVAKTAKGALALAKEAGKNVAAAEKAVATAKDVEAAVRFGIGAEGAARQIAAVERYTDLLRTAQSAAAHAADFAKGARGAWLKGRALQSLGRLSAFSSFAQEFIDNADADGLSREDSVPTAAFVGVINAMVERLYVPGMESSLNPAEIKAIMWRSAVEAWRHERMAGLRKWAGNYVRRNVVEGAKVFATEGLVEEELQQLDTEIGKALDRRRKELREAGRGDLADFAGDLWKRMMKAEGSDIADSFGKAWAIYVDTAAEVLPSSVGFGLGTVPIRKAKQHIANRWGRGRANVNGDQGVAYVIDAERRARREIAAWWEAEGEEGRRPDGISTPNDALAAARRAFREAREGGGVELMQQIADAADVDLKTAEAVHDALQAEAELELVSPRVRMEINLADPVTEVSEKDVKAILPGYVDGSFLADRENGLYSARLKLASGEERTLVYRIGDMSQWAADRLTPEGLAEGGEIAASYEARRAAESAEEMRPWSQLTEEERYDFGLKNINGMTAGGGGVFQFVADGGRTVTVSADDVISLASGHLADVGYGARATGATLRHETFHALWRFMKETISPEDRAALYSHFQHLDPKAESDKDLDEAMAQEFERYASGEYVPQQVKGRIEAWTGWAMEKLGGLLGALGFGAGDGPRRADGSRFTLKGFYDAVLAGRLGSGALGVELRDISAPSAQGGRNGKDEERTPEGIAVPQTPEAQSEKATAESAGNAAQPAPEAAPVLAATAEHPAPPATPNQRYYKVGLPNGPVKLVGRLEVRDVDTGIITSTDADYHDRGNQNRDDKSEESRALVEKIGANPDPLQIGTVQPIASNGIIWMLPNGDVIIGNHRVNGVRLGYAKGTTAELEKFVREDAAKRGIKIGEDVKKPLMVFVLERIESPDGKADVHEVVRLANESQNRGFNVREQAGNDAKILQDNNLLPRMEFRADGRIDETKSGDAIGKFRQETGAQGMISEDGSLTEEGQARIQNAALAVLLGGEGNNALLQKIMTNAGRLDMSGELRALMKMTPELMALAEAKPAYDLRAPLAEALQLFTEWRDRDETARVEKGKTRHDWRETAADGHRLRGVSWETFMSQGDMFRAPSDEARILGDLFAGAERLRSFDREDVESAAGKKRVIDLISGYLTDYIRNARAVNTETEDMFGGTPATRADVLAAQRATGGENGAVRFSVEPHPTTTEEINRIVEHFGTTSNINEAGYILPDGRMLDLSGRNEGATGGRRTLDHRDVWDVIDDRDNGSDAMADFVSGGAIRLQPEAFGVMFGAKPTEAQEATLIRYFARFNGEMNVDIMAPNGDFVSSASYSEGTRPQRILNEIKRYYDEGTELAGTGEQADGSFRYSVAAKPAGRNKSANVIYPNAGEEISSMRFSIGAKRREEYSRLLAKHRPDLRAEAILDELDKYDNPKKEKLTLHWIVRGSIWLPNDESKVDQAIEVAEKAKVDPFKYASPLALIDAHADIHPTEKRIDPSTVPELTDARDEGNGVVSYEVADTSEGQAAMRRIIDTHWGEDANPWCLLARVKKAPVLTAEFWNWMHEKHGGNTFKSGMAFKSEPSKWKDLYKKETNLEAEETPDEMGDAWDYWNHYNALPKRVAFKDGKLLAFMATEGMDEDQAFDDAAYGNGSELARRLPDLYAEYEQWQESEEGQNEGANFYQWLDHEHYDELRDALDNPSEEWWDRQDASHIGHDGLMEIAGAKGDIRYSIAARLDEERKELEAKGGRLVLAHHGTDSAGFTVFEKSDAKGYFFAKSRTTAGSYIRKGHRSDVNKKALPDYQQLLKEKEDEGWIERGFALVNKDGSLTGELGSRYSDRVFADRETAQMHSVGREVVEALSYNDELYRADKGIPYSALLNDGEQRSGVYDVALRMEDPYVIDGRGANWDHIIDWDGAESRDDTVVYDKIAVEPEEGHIYLELRENGQSESNYESFATLEDAAKWAETNLGEDIAERIRRAAEQDTFFEDAGRTLDIVDERYPYAFDSSNNEGWFLPVMNTREVVDMAFDMGCDGVIFKNIVDNGGGVVDAYEDEVYVVKDAKQVKLVDEMTYADDGSIIPAEARLDWSNPDIRYSVSAPLVEAMENRERRALETSYPDIRYSIRIDPDMSKPENAKAFREYLAAIPAKEMPERLTDGRPKAALEWFEKNLVGRTFAFDIPGIGKREFRVNEGHLFRLVCDSTGGTVRKGFVAKAKNAGDARRMMRNGEVDSSDVAGWNESRARSLPLVPEILTGFDALMRERDRPGFLVFIKKFVSKSGHVNTVVMRLNEDGITLGPMSAHVKDLTDAWLKKQDLTVTNDGKVFSTRSDNSATGQVDSKDNAERNSLENADNIPHPSDEIKRGRASFDFGDAYPQLNRLHDEDLAAVVLGVRLALGNTSEERFGKITKATAHGIHLKTAKRLLRSVRPDLDEKSLAHEVYFATQKAAKLARALREDMDRGVTESTILRHLPDTMRRTFGEEVKSQTLRGVRLGRFGESAEDRLEARAREIEAAATRNVTGIELSTMEAAWGIDLTATLLAMPPPQTDGADAGVGTAAEGTGGEGGARSAQSDEDQAPRKEVDEKIRKAVRRIVGNTAVQANLGEANRKYARDAAGRDAEREAEMAAEGTGGEGGAGDVQGDGDIVAEAVAKEGVNVNSPLHLALLVKEMVRARWCQEHDLDQNAEPWHNAVAKQFLRRSAANIYERLGRDLCYSAGRETVMRHCASLENVPTVDGIVSEMEFIGRVIARWRIRDSQKRLCEKIDAFLQEKFGAKGRFRPGTLLVERVKEATDAAKERGEPERHGVSAEAQLMAKYMRHAMWLSVEGAEQEAEDIRRDLAAATVEFRENDSDVEQSRVMADAVRKLNILREWGALQHRTPAEIEAAAEWWRKFYDGESDAIVGEWEKREERTVGIAAAFARGVRNPNRKHSRTKRTIADVANEYIQANYGGFMHLLRDLMRFADDATIKECEPYLQWLELEIQKCGTRAATEKRKNVESFRKAVEAIYGKRWEKVVAELTEEDERFEKFMGEDDDGVKVAPTRGRAMQLLASLVQLGRRIEVPDEENPGETKTVWVGGYHDNIVKYKREEQADELKRLLSPQDLKLIAWMRRWYEQNRTGLSGVSQRLFGIGVYAETGNYMPVKMMLDPQGLEKADGVGWSIFPKSLTPRVKNERDFDTSADILEVWGARMDEAAQWKTHAALGLELRGIFGRAEFQKAVRASHGAAANRLVLGYITDILSGHGTSDGTGVKSFLDSARGWASVGSLGGNVGVMLKQMTSIPAFGFEIGAVKTATHFVTAFTPAGVSAMLKLIDSDERKNRWTGGNTEAVANAMRVKSPNALKRFLLASMITNKVGDIVPALVIGQGIYRDALERGMSDEDAMAYTWMLVERTQQSSRVENRAAFQRRNSIGNAIYQFLSTQQQYLNYEVRAGRAVLADKTNLRKWGDLANAAVLNHFVLSSLYYWMGQLYRALLGQEPPEDQLKDWVVGMILGPYGALYGMGITTTDAVNNWIKGYQYGKDNAVPSLSWLGSVIVRDPVRLVHDAFDRKKKWSDVVDDLGRWCADFNATFRDLRKIYEFRVKDRDPLHFQMLDDGRKKRRRPRK